MATVIVHPQLLSRSAQMLRESLKEAAAAGEMGKALEGSGGTVPGCPSFQVPELYATLLKSFRAAIPTEPATEYH